MHKIVRLLSLAIFMVVSCSKSNVVTTEESPDQEGEKLYETIDLTFNPYTVSVEEIIENRPDFYYNNNTSVQQKVPINPTDILERSVFKPIQRDTYKVIDSTKLVSVPIQINNDIITVSDKKWNYSEIEEVKMTSLNFKDSTFAEPQTGVKVSMYVVYQRMKTSYVLRLKDIDTQDTISVTGEWTGMYPVDVRTSLDVYDL